MQQVLARNCLCHLQSR